MKRLILINQFEKDLIDKIKDNNLEDGGMWQVPNLLIPMATIVLAILANLTFGANKTEPLSYLNLIVNGSIPLIALNQISALGILVFEYDKSKEKQLGLGHTVKLRRRLFYYSLIILTLSIVFYCYQVISSPFTNYWLIILLLALSFPLIWSSTKVSQYTFYLQENFINKTFDQEVIEDMNKQGHGKNWTKED